MLKKMSNNIYIRKAKESEVEQIAKVHSVSAYRAYDGVMSKEMIESFWSYETLIDDWKKYINQAKTDKNLISYVAVENGEVLGVLRASPADEHDLPVFKNGKMTEEELNKYVHFKTIYIDPNHQGRGIGRMFLTYAALEALKNGKTNLLTLTGDKYEGSPKFFKSYGAQFKGQHKLDMSEHYGTVSSQYGIKEVITNIWAMDAKQILVISLEKDRRYDEEKASKINNIKANKLKFINADNNNRNTNAKLMPLFVYAKKGMSK